MTGQLLAMINHQLMNSVINVATQIKLYGMWYRYWGLDQEKILATYALNQA